MRRALLAVLAVAALQGCAVMVGLDRPLDPRWTYPDCRQLPSQGVVGVPAWMCPPPGPWNSESGYAWSLHVAP